MALLIVRMNSLAWAKGSEKPVYPQGYDLEEKMTYVRKHQFHGLKKAAAAFEIMTNSDVCALSFVLVSATVTRALSDGKMAVVNAPAGSDTAMVHVTVHATRTDVPKTEEPKGVNILCNSAMSVEITDGKSPPTQIFRHSRSFSVPAGNHTNPVLHEIEAALDEFTTAVRAVRLVD
jgi:hypothetical protein